MLDRKKLIFEVTKYEIQWFLDQRDQSYVEDMAQFFADGGFTNCSDEDLIEKYNLFIKEESADA